MGLGIVKTCRWILLKIVKTLIFLSASFLFWFSAPGDLGPRQSDFCIFLQISAVPIDSTAAQLKPSGKTGWWVWALDFLFSLLPATMIIAMKLITTIERRFTSTATAFSQFCWALSIFLWESFLRPGRWYRFFTSCGSEGISPIQLVLWKVGQAVGENWLQVKKRFGGRLKNRLGGGDSPCYCICT